MIHSELGIDKIKNIYKLLQPHVNKTPLLKANEEISNYFNTRLFFKCEFLQKSGSFKVRGATNSILSLNKESLNNGITAVSAGNHAIAACYVASKFKLKNKIFLYKSANKYRINTCENFNANLIFTEADEGFKNVKIAEDEGYTFIHPFDGAYTLQGTASLGYEIYNQVKEIDNVIIAIGGGGLISGVGSLLKQINPKIKIIGVEPENAKGMSQSIKSGYALSKVNVRSIADSLCAPLHMPYSFSVANDVIDEIITISDQEMIEYMKFSFKYLKLFLEPACVCGMAALKNKIKKRFINQNTIIILCGSNIDYITWNKLISNGSLV